jgi:hypothetical protein
MTFTILRHIKPAKQTISIQNIGQVDKIIIFVNTKVLVFDYKIISLAEKSLRY